MTDNNKELTKMIGAINKRLNYYSIELSTSVLGEDGKYTDNEDGNYAGYAVVNNVTGIVEHTSTVLPGVVFQAQHFDSTLKSLLSTPKPPESVNEAPADDVLIN